MLTILLGCGQKSIEQWYGGKPDTIEYDQWLPLYEYYFKDIENVLGVDIRDNDLARQRITNLINKAVSHWQDNKNDVYRLEVKYLIIYSDEPKHYEFVIYSNQIAPLSL